MTLKVHVWVSNGRIAWSTAKTTKRLADGASGTASDDYFMRIKTYVRFVAIGYFQYGIHRAEPIVLIEYRVGTGFHDLVRADRLFY